MDRNTLNDLLIAALLIVAWGGTYTLYCWQLRSQRDHLAIKEIETVEGLLFFTPDGQLQLRESYHNHPETKKVVEGLLEVRSPDGSLLFRNERLGDRVLGGTLLKEERKGEFSGRSTRLSDGTRVRIVSGVHSLNGHLLLIRMAHIEEPLFLFNRL